MEERKGAVTFKGKPMTFVGKEVRPGTRAPDFEALDNTFHPVKLSTFLGKTVIISSIISLDTSVCDAQTRKFNEEAAKLGKEVVILTLSMDLPYAQKRWCGAAGINEVRTLSDHKKADFGTQFGVLIKEMRLLGRAVFIIDKEGVVRHAHYLKDTSEHPDYEQVLKEVQQLL